MKTVKEYLELGCDQKTAEYFASGRKKMISVVPMPDYKLLLSFNNGEERILDMKSSIQPGTVFYFLKDEANFNRVYLDPVDSSVAWDIDPNVDSEIVWNNKVDLCPDSCYIDSVPVSKPSPG